MMFYVIFLLIVSIVIRVLEALQIVAMSNLWIANASFLLDPIAVIIGAHWVKN